MEELQNERREYKRSVLKRSKLNADPFTQFSGWVNDAKNSSLTDPTAMVLATSDERGQKSQRSVLMKGFNQKGIVFFTNLNSKKGDHFLENNRLSMCFYWHSINRQVRVVGKGRVIPDRQSDKYFSSRLRGSQIGAWASDQSSVIASKKDLIQKIRYYKKEFKDKLVPRPGRGQVGYNIIGPFPLPMLASP